MRRTIMLMAGVAVLALVLSAGAADTEPPSRLEASSVQELPPRAPEPRFTRTTYAATDLASSTALIDECKGPIAIWLGENRPTLIAEHDYCGGAAWVAKVRVGDAVKIDGDGVNDGVYIVTSLSYETRNEVTVGDLPDADAVLQTCVSDTTLVLAGMERFEA